MAEDKKRTFDLVDRSGYEFSLTNGQRLYGPPPRWLGPPPKDTEVFIGKLPNNIYEYDLVPLFSTVGKIYMLRLMQNFSGFSRGYAFIQYTTPEEAKKAIELLNNVEIRPGEQIGVVKSRNNCRLYVGNLCKTLTKEELLSKMKTLANDVLDVSFNSSSNPNDNTNKGFAFVEFTSHKAAALARRKLVPCKTVFNNQEITVDWATPITELGIKLKTECTLLFKNFKYSISNENIYKYISVRGRLKIVKFKRIFNQALISFDTKHETELALKIFESMKNSHKFFFFYEPGKKIELMPINENMDLKRFIDCDEYIPQVNNTSSVNQPTSSSYLNNTNCAESSNCSSSNSQIDKICGNFDQLNLTKTPVNGSSNVKNNLDTILEMVQTNDLSRIYDFPSSKHLYNPNNFNNQNDISNESLQSPFGHWNNEDYYKSSKVNLFSPNTQTNQYITNQEFFEDFDNIFDHDSNNKPEDKSNDFKNKPKDFF